MKFNLVLAITCLALGASLSWFLKPDAEPTTADLEETKSPNSGPAAPSPSDSKREISDRAIVKSDRSPKLSVQSFGDGNEIDDKMQNRITEMFKKRKMDKVDAQISKLAAQLSLTPVQEAALRKAVEEKIAGSNIRDVLSGDGIDEALVDILTPEQKEEHEAVKKRELANKVEAQALKNLAKLSTLDLSPEQKDAAYDILYKQAENTVTADSGTNNMVSMLTSGLGIEIDSDDLNLATSFIPEIENGAAEGEVVTPNPKEMMAQMKEKQEKQIDEKVEALRPVLNDNQLEQYRKDLELKSGGIFGGLLNGIGTGE